ncbi:PREDICTED: homeobox protein LUMINIDEPENDENS-like isoform X2 [Nelumbo nucifera]|uniref:Homeobox protein LUMINIDEPENDENS-like isoform X2 n=1 Tax=Nelumbo nucifera TaxID=4432 RepID=A0A1U8B0T2_NELNU|nr:PREDICTED: homeobox protein LUMINIDEPENDENS-like isoform X2 [Nelumbo nucifera]
MEACMENSTNTFQMFVESQKELFDEQIDQLQKIVVRQCKLTGANPLSQEMAAGALSIKIGKRPRDLLNPKAVKYMQSLFSIKDTISKKESREISALCGVTVMQVREFFAGQRSRVRKLVQLSKEKVVRSNAGMASHDGCSTNSNHVMPISPVPLNSVDPKTVEEAPSCSSQDETIPDIDNSDKNFLENIFNLMRKEETFSGQVKLMEWILQIQNSSVLYWFLTKDGLMILATWLSQAALEEQTTVLLVILKVLCHLPLHKALPVHMSAILQTVNRLRFYRTSDISNRARVLLSRWSKLFVRSQALKKPTSVISNGEAHEEIIRNQRIGEILSDEVQVTKVDIPVLILWGQILSLTSGSSEVGRESESYRALKLLPASADDSNRRHTRIVSLPQTRERRRVLLVEQPGQKTGGRNQQGAKVVTAIQGRPMSADDIQKAKMRATFLQSKYGKTGSPSKHSLLQRTEDPVKSSASQTSNSQSIDKTPIRSKVEEDTKSTVLGSKNSPIMLKTPVDLKPSLELRVPPEESLKRGQIPWQTPPELRINGLWGIGAGEKSKEVEIQTERLRREKETFYHNIQDIPINPKEPWDLEIDYDDTLTPEIPIEQLPDDDAASLPSPCQNNGDKSATTPVGTNNGSAPEPDLELLAVLLKNPELVFALTSGQCGNLTSEETVKLLDMIKASGIGLPGGLNGSSGKAEQKLEITSLPSPTPPSERRMSAWRSEGTKSLLQPPVPATKGGGSGFPAVPATVSLLENPPATTSVRPQLPTTVITSQIPTVITQLSQQLLPALQPSSSQQTLAAGMPENQLTAMNPSPNQRLLSSPLLPMTHIPVTCPPSQNLHASSPLLRPETSSIGQMHNLNSATVSIVLNPPNERQLVSVPQLPPLLPTPTRPQPPLLPEPPIFSPSYPTMPLNASNSGKQGPFSDSTMDRQGSASNSIAHTNQSNYNAFLGQPPLLSATRWETKEFTSEPELEMWSPERSPMRSPEYRSGWNFTEARRDYGRNSRPDWSRHRSSGRLNRDCRHGGRRWHDRRH